MSTSDSIIVPGFKISHRGAISLIKDRQHPDQDFLIVEYMENDTYKVMKIERVMDQDNKDDARVVCREMLPREWLAMPQNCAYQSHTWEGFSLDQRTRLQLCIEKNFQTELPVPEKEWKKKNPNSDIFGYSEYEKEQYELYWFMKRIKDAIQEDPTTLASAILNTFGLPSSRIYPPFYPIQAAILYYEHIPSFHTWIMGVRSDVDYMLNQAHCFERSIFIVGVLAVTLSVIGIVLPFFLHIQASFCIALLAGALILLGAGIALLCPAPQKILTRLWMGGTFPQKVLAAVQARPQPPDIPAQELPAPEKVAAFYSAFYSALAQQASQPSPDDEFTKGMNPVMKFYRLFK